MVGYIAPRQNAGGPVTVVGGTPRRTPRTAQRFLKCEEGANLVEAAFVLPILLLLICGILEYGAVVYTQMALQNGASQATRYAITRLSQPNMSRADSIKQVLRTKTPGITIDDANISLSYLSPGSTTWLSGTGPAESIEKLTVTYQWHAVTPLMARFFPPNGVTLRAESVMKDESDPDQ
jgi:Flp pilus assembly protein TadG